MIIKIIKIIKLFDWLFQRNFHNLLFKHRDGLTLLICLMIKVKDVYKLLEQDNIISSTNPNVPQPQNTDNIKGKKKAITIITNNPQQNIQQMNKMYHLICIIIQKIIVNLLKLNDEFYNNLFIKAKFGFLLGELLLSQYQFLSNVFDKKKNDINIFNNYILENKLRAQFIEGILENSKDEIKLQFLDVFMF